MKKLVILIFLSVGFFASNVCAERTDESTVLPNIIYILADDLGYGDLSCYGQKKFQTPNIDALAEKGMTFTQHYSGSTVCAPSRCSLLTGLHQGYAAVRGNLERPPEGQMPMLKGTYTMAEHLKKAGYRTGIFGKWGLGYPGSTSDPLNVGFDRFYGYNCQYMAHSYYPAWLWSDTERDFLWGNVGSFHKDYAPDFIHKETLDFIRENKDRPFFVYYALVQPHADMIAPEEYMNKYRGKYLPESSYDGGYYCAQPEGHAAFVAMVDIMDTYVGEVMVELETLGIAQHTLVIFASDNGAHSTGGHDAAYFNSTGGFRGKKRDLYEGGVRVPMIATWPGKIKAGSESDHISAFWDFLPTVAEIVKVPLTVKTDGISILPTLLDQPGQQRHDNLYWEFHARGGRVALRKGKWKAVRYNVTQDPDSTLELYDLSTDPTESRNLAGLYPEVVAEMDAIIRKSRTPSPHPEFNFPSLKK
ncbi:arylsulfatase [Pontiella agarivorans]|uniref:Arylsulfatase n=1 Tax=Pontiella agarivorans TaxID=3038953 RepID=A0ABU5N1Y7_9BACT|nr:arylsulfatase [Pontiella agarivorans]MDZ8120464.1 arylsulfatase [Pontiella agarivorans]